MNHASVSPTDGNGPTQGQRKTLTRVGIEPTTFGLDLRRYLLYTYRDLRSKEDRDKNSLFVLERPTDWSYNFCTSEKRRIDALIGCIVIFISEKLSYQPFDWLI